MNTINGQVRHDRLVFSACHISKLVGLYPGQHLVHPWRKEVDLLWHLDLRCLRLACLISMDDGWLGRSRTG